MQRYGMSFLRNFTATKLASNLYSCSAAGMTGNPPFSFGAVFLTSETPNASANLGIWGNLNLGANTGWGIYVADEWETLTNQIITCHIGTTTMTVGSNGTGDRISSGLGRANFVVCTCDADRGTSNLYYQGQWIATDTDPTIASSADDVYMGYLAGGCAPFLLGGVNMAFYTNNVLTQAEVQGMWSQLQYYGRLPESVAQEANYPQNLNWPVWYTATAPTGIDIDYLWQVHHLPHGGYTPFTEPTQIPASAVWNMEDWDSHSTSGAATKTLEPTDTDLALPTLYQEYVPRVQWAGIIPQTPA